MKPMNVLLINSHEHRYDCLAGHGHPLIKTPGFDRLMAEGVDFTRAYATSALTSAARAGLITGQWPVQMQSGSAWGLETFRTATDREHTVPGRLKEVGYGLGWVGNFFHETAETPEELGFDVFVNDDRYLAWRRGQGLPAFTAPDWGGAIDTTIREHDSRLAWSQQQVRTTIESLGEGAAPWFVRWDPLEPSTPVHPPYPFGSQYQPETIMPWPSFPDTLEGKPSIHAAHRQVWHLDQMKWDDWAPVVSRYLGEVCHLDHQIRGLLDYLDEAGLAESTVVIYTSDHGAMVGSHGLLGSAYLAYEDVLHVPLIVRWPGRLEAGTTCDHFVHSSIDIAATIAEIAELPLARDQAGMCLAENVEEEADYLRPDTFSAWPGGLAGTFRQRVVREVRWKYVWNASTEDELYDLDADPHEMTNRIHDPACDEELRRLRERLLDWMTDLDDPVATTWTAIAINSGLTVI